MKKLKKEDIYINLQGKSKEDFYNWIFNNLKEQYFGDLQDVYDYFDSLHNSCKNALIIEFFDKYEMYIGVNVMYAEEHFTYEINIQGYHFVDNTEFNNRQEATTEAIKKANEIYNGKNI